MQKLIGDGWLKEEFRDQLKYVLIHSLRADDALADLSAASKLCTDWSFLQTLRDRGREAASVWLAAHYEDVGKRQTVDLRAQFLNSGSEMRQVPVVEVPLRAPVKSSRKVPVKAPTKTRKVAPKSAKPAMSRRKSSR